MRVCLCMSAGACVCVCVCVCVCLCVRARAHHVSNWTGGGGGRGGGEGGKRGERAEIILCVYTKCSLFKVLSLLLNRYITEIHLIAVNYA